MNCIIETQYLLYTCFEHRFLYRLFTNTKNYEKKIVLRPGSHFCRPYGIRDTRTKVKECSRFLTPCVCILPASNRHMNLYCLIWGFFKYWLLCTVLETMKAMTFSVKNEYFFFALLLALSKRAILRKRIHRWK